MGPTQTEQRNGIALDLVSGTAQAFGEHPGAAAVRIRTTHQWEDGFAVAGRVAWAEQAGERADGRHAFRGDWPEPFGRDSGPTSAEMILAAVGSCVAATYALKAAVAGVAVDEIEVAVTGALDLRGFFETEAVRPGLSGVEVELTVHSGAEPAVLEELGRTVRRTSPALDVLANPVDVDVRVTRAH